MYVYLYIIPNCITRPLANIQVVVWIRVVLGAKKGISPGGEGTFLEDHFCTLCCYFSDLLD